MSHQNPPDATLRDLLLGARTIAVVGASASPERPSHRIMRSLLAAGYRVIPVNPRWPEVLGQRAYPTLADLGEPVDIVDVFRRAEHAPAIADQAVAAGARVLWLQSGIVSDEAAARAAAGGLTVVMDLCLGATHRRLAIPRR